jgi:hypothetical protein
VKAFKYYLHIPSGRQLADDIRTLRRRAGLPPGKAPHLTIVPPYRGNSQLYAGSESEILLKLRLQASIGQLQQPMIESVGFEVFDDGKTLIVTVRKTPELQSVLGSISPQYQQTRSGLGPDDVQPTYHHC